jgi:MFS family permease
MGGLDRGALWHWGDGDGGVINADALVFGALIVTGGRRADRFGRRRLFFLGSATFAAFSALGATAQREWWLIACRSLMGIGGGDDVAGRARHGLAGQPGRPRCLRAASPRGVSTGLLMSTSSDSAILDFMPRAHRAAPGPLHYAAFRRALVGRTVSAAGSWMQTVAAGWLVFDLTGSASAVGVLAFLSRGPGMLVSAYGGELADRYDRRRLVVVLFGCQAVPAALLAALAWEDISRVTEVYAATLLIGSAEALANPALQQIVTATVPPELAKRATGLGSVSYNSARLVGPAVGGGLVAAVGPGPCFALNALTYFAVIVVVASLPSSAGAAPGQRNRVRAAICEARLDPFLRGLIMGAVIFSILVAPVQELAPAIAGRHGDGAHLLGFLLTALAAGGLVGNPVRARLDRRGVAATTAIGGSMLTCAATLLAVAASSNYVLVLAALVVCGTAWDVVYVVSLTGVQFAHPRMSGLMTGLFFTASLGGVTLGALIVGGLFDLVGVSVGLAICGIATALGGVWALRVPAGVSAAISASSVADY